jgi:hypothetical protein
MSQCVMAGCIRPRHPDCGGFCALDYRRAIEGVWG